ncbi:hypothetical protein ACSBR2_012255 [Camellia fascicularis]
MFIRGSGKGKKGTTCSLIMMMKKMKGSLGSTDKRDLYCSSDQQICTVVVEQIKQTEFFSFVVVVNP